MQFLFKFKLPFKKIKKQYIILCKSSKFVIKIYMNVALYEAG